MSENEPTDEELKEAAALAEALESKEPRASSADDALAAAQLVRYSRNGGALTPEHLARGQQELKSALARRRRRNWSAGIAAAAAALLIGVSALQLARPRYAAPPTRADPQREVLLAQAHALAAHDPAALELAMRSYRASWLRGLESEYGGAR